MDDFDTAMFKSIGLIITAVGFVWLIGKIVTHIPAFPF